MRTATLETYSAAHDALKSRHPRLSGNIFMDAPRLEAAFTSKRCLLHESDNSLFLLIPRHSFHDVLYLTGDAGRLPGELAGCLADWPVEQALRVSVIGREPEAGAMAAQFQKAGFFPLKKLLRTRLRLPEANILAAMRPFAEEMRDQLGYARHGDEAEILEILRESFDPMGDNLPELAEISERIDEGCVAVLRQGGKILSLKYFTVQGGVLHSLYDVTRKEYRGGNGFFMALAVFVQEELEARGVNCARSLGWRDATQKKLLRHAKKSNQHADGIVIYNMRWPSASPLPA